MFNLILFFTFAKVGLFSFGGGYAILALLQKEVVEIHKWISPAEFTEIVALSQITPGPISINLATHVGYKMGGFMGSTMATLGSIFPSVVVISIIVIFLKKFSDSKFIERTFKSLRLVVVGLILGAALALLIKDNFIDYKSFIIFFIILSLGFMTKISSIYLIIISGVLGYGFYTFI